MILERELTNSSKDLWRIILFLSLSPARVQQTCIALLSRSSSSSEDLQRFGEEVRRCYGVTDRCKAVACWFSTISSTGTSRYSLSSSQRLFSTSHRPTTTRLFIPNASNRKKSIPNKSPPSPKSTPETEAISQKKFPGRSKDERPNSIADGNSGRSNTGRSQSTAFKSFGVQKKDTKGFLLDLKDQQVETGNLQDATFLNAVAKLGLGSVLRGPLEDAKTDAVTPRLNCQLQSCPIELLHPPEDCNVNSSLSFTLQICRVENILVEGRIEGSVVHFHRPRTIAIDSLGAISTSGMEWQI